MLTDSSLASQATHNVMERHLRNLKWACCREYLGSATCVQHSIGSRNSAIRNAYHTSLRPSSLFEPRHPSLKVVTSLGSCAIPCLPAKVCEGVQITRQIGRPAIHTPNETRFVCTNQVSHMIIHRVWDFACNDPSAGSPTETLLRLLLPLSDKVH